MLGLSNKGRLAPGADGDVVVVDPNIHQAVLTVAGGKVIMVDGIVIGSGGPIVTTKRGVKALQIPRHFSRSFESDRQSALYCSGRMNGVIKRLKRLE
jgi:hypothetical protein